MAVPTTSTVSVLVMDCTRTGALPPTVTVQVPQVMLAWRVLRSPGAAICIASAVFSDNFTASPQNELHFL